MNKILAILAAIFAIACTSSKTTVYDFSAETNNGFIRNTPLMAKSDVNGKNANEVFKL